MAATSLVGRWRLDFSSTSRDRFYYTWSQDADNETTLRIWSLISRLTPPKDLLLTSLRSRTAYYEPTLDPWRTLFSWMLHDTPIPLALFALMNCGTLNCCEGHPASSQHPFGLPHPFLPKRDQSRVWEASALRPTLFIRRFGPGCALFTERSHCSGTSRVWEAPPSSLSRDVYIIPSEFLQKDARLSFPSAPSSCRSGSWVRLSVPSSSRPGLLPP